MSIWKTPDQKPTSDNDIVCMVGDLPFVGHYDNDYQAYLEHASGDCYAVDEIDRWAYLSDIIPAADRAERLHVELDETKKALHRDWETRNDCLIKILESYLNFAGLVRAYPNVPALPTFRAGNIIYDWSPVLEFMKNGRTARALERLKTIEPDQICPKCGEKMTETMLLSLPPQTQYRCNKCGYTEDKRDK